MATILFTERHDFLRDTSLIELITTLSGDRAVGRTQLRQGHNFTDLRSTPLLQVDSRRIGPRGETLHRAPPSAPDDVTDGKALLGGVDARLKQFFKRHRPKSGPQFLPAIDASRDRPRQRTGFGNLSFCVGFLAQQGSRQLEWTAARGIQTIKLLRLVVPIDSKQIAADATTHWLDNTQHCVCRDRRISCVASRLEDVQARLCRQRLTGCHNSMFRHNDRSTLVGLFGWSIVLGRISTIRATKVSHKKNPHWNQQKNEGTDVKLHGVPLLEISLPETES